MNNSPIKIKRIGTREEVFNGVAKMTSGGMTRDMIVKTIKNNKVNYASKKISDRMKYVIKQRGNNFKNCRKTIKSTNQQQSKTRKNTVSFCINKNRVQEYYCPELNNYHYDDDNNDNDDNTEFIIEDMPNISLRELFT